LNFNRDECEVRASSSSGTQEKSMHIGELQEIIRRRDYRSEHKTGYFLKLVEEVGELSKAIRKGEIYEGSNAVSVKGTIDEELYDVLYYVLALANVYGIDMEQAIALKEDINLTRQDH
jgi:NTP pyrophosphatase (non-canonical NTP hydrolase)